jgi:hypothetical protein
MFTICRWHLYFHRNILGDYIDQSISVHLNIILVFEILADKQISIRLTMQLIQSSHSIQDVDSEFDNEDIDRAIALSLLEEEHWKSKGTG